MTEPWTSSLAGEAVYRARVRGCLLGGALGDTLGHPTESSSLERIRAAHGERGVTGPVFAGDSDVARISDDTQTTPSCWCAGCTSARWRPSGTPAPSTPHRRRRAPPRARS